ncbi:hypothetical protein [Sinorhizobium meliloti]|uniref:hypothetical protein n=1 Tax=Rhizobium meliloti TaxID=382 RepID=UPI0002FD6EC6|nr:hypothetical protein [Sinorhizobium meliloti]MDE4605040.1 hypothetical protein [Sinorhizobium meliloti]UDU21688.1 hypothetical protein LJD24_23735 [Sinorhizobium meliloti]
MVITAALMVLVVNAVTTFMEVSRVGKRTLAAVIGVWIGVAAATAAAARKAMLSVPMRVLVAPNIVSGLRRAVSHVGGGGRLIGPLPAQRRWGGIITPVVAVPVLWLLKDAGERHSRAISLPGSV